MNHVEFRNIVAANRSLLSPATALSGVLLLAGCSGSEPTILAGSGGSVGFGGSSSSSAAGGSSPVGGSSAHATGGTTAISSGGTTAQSSATGGQSNSSGGAGTTTVGGSKAVGGSTAVGGSKAVGGTTASGGAGATAGKSSTGGASTGGASTSATGGAGGGSAGSCFAENCGTDCNATAAPMLAAKNPKLPDPFAMHAGTRISAKADWKCRRNEIKADIEKYEIGPKQEPGTVAATLSSGTLSVKVTTSSGSITISSKVSGSGSCVAIGMNGASSIVSGCTQIPFMHDNVVAYANGTGSQSQSDPFYKVYPSMWGKIGNYSAWSWGISRLIDGIVQLKDELKVDPTKIAVQGCSYAGKMALFGGAFDERVALTVAQESGGGGITSWRTSQDFTTRTGTNVEKIDNTNYAWFMSSMKSLDPYKLPHDHHELIAMTAPRAIIILGNPEMEWLADESGYKSTMAALEVFKGLGIADHLGYDFTGNHDHCAAPATQVASVKTFVDKFLKGGTGASNVAIKPNSSKFDLDATKVIDWTTPTLQ